MRARWVPWVLFLFTGGQLSAQELKGLSVEELMQIDVTTAGRREEPVGTTAAPVSVITSDDLRRSGVTTLADALVLADGVHTARTASGNWVISARGFNQATPNKLLVMVDGRTVYSPLFAGVFWNMQDYLLEDVDRIEVIRGPGATLWGANAVNGIVNIITKHAGETQGVYASASAGTEDRAIAEVRYGGRTPASPFRVYAKVADRDGQLLASGQDAGDARRRGQVGFRIDGGNGARGISWLVKADAFHSRERLGDDSDAEFTELALQGRWSMALDNASRVDLQSYYRREHRNLPTQLNHHVDVFDVDGQHAGTWGRHGVVWGGGIRINRDVTDGTAAIHFDPANRTYQVVNVFLQDDLAVMRDKVFITPGVKYEYNMFSGGEVQPAIRGRVLLPRAQVLWGAVSRAVRRPTRLEDDIVFVGPGGVTIARGNDNFVPESLVATEFGYRMQPAATLSFDVSVFRHEFDDLRSLDLPPTGPPLAIGNSLDGSSRGVEIGVNVQPVPWWRTHVGYTWLDTEVTPQPGSRDIGGGVTEANDPHHLFNLRTSFDLPRSVEADAIIRAVGALPNPVVPAYTELTARVGWHPSARYEVWIVGDDLLHDSHPEFGADVPTRVELQRGIRAGLTVRF